MRMASIVLLEDQDRGIWNRELIAEGLALVDKALRHSRPGPYQVQAAISPACMPMRGGREDTDWAEIDQLYGVLERMQPSPVVTPQPRGGRGQAARAGGGAGADRAAGRAARRLFPLSSA